jgi:hypothetical protein
MNTDQFRQQMSELPEYTGLDSLIKLTDMPALDPHIIEWQHQGCNEKLAEVVYRCLTGIRRRLFNAGFSNYEQGIIASPNILKYLKNYLRFETLKLKPIKSASGGNSIYILTKRAGGKLFIHPPCDNHNQIISWDEYFLRTARGEKLPLMIVAPWAQAKIMDIE